MTFDLTERNAVDYLASRGLVNASDVASAELLGWGISNTLVKVRTAHGCLVVKQSLAHLRVKEDWPADRRRIYQEKACIDVLGRILEPGDFPAALYEDRENFLFVMSCAPEESVYWKDRLLAGRVDHRVARKAGEILGRIHASTYELSDIREQFADQEYFVQLRIDPYHRAVARVHPDVAEVIDREAERMLGQRCCLVHGDYSPKNILVTARRPFLLDFEVAHYGNPAFDLAFMLSHLFLKSIFNGQRRKQYFQAVDQFWRGYYGAAGLAISDYNVGRGATPASRAPDSSILDLNILETDTIKQLGCLMLARIDGKSPVEYITSPKMKDLVRSIAKRLLKEDHWRLSDVSNLVESELEQNGFIADEPSALARRAGGGLEVDK